MMCKLIKNIQKKEKKIFQISIEKKNEFKKIIKKNVKLFLNVPPLNKWFIYLLQTNHIEKKFINFFVIACVIIVALMRKKFRAPPSPSKVISPSSTYFKTNLIYSNQNAVMSYIFFIYLLIIRNSYIYRKIINWYWMSEWIW